MTNPDEKLEQAIQRLGREFLDTAVRLRQQARWRDQWVGTLLRRLQRNPDFRIQALRFIDVLPALQDDAELLRHFQEHFSAKEFPLPGLGKLAGSAGWMVGSHALAKAVRAVTAILSRQYMGGERAEELVPLLERFKTDGRLLSLDLLGEMTVSEQEADRYQQAYVDLLESFPRGQPDQPLHLSIKLSSLLPRIQPHKLADDSHRVLDRLLPLLHKASLHQASVTLDMEDYDKRPLILQVLKEVLFSSEFRHWTGIGIALQTYLKDAQRDLDLLLEWARQRRTPFTVRLVRGAYWDQENIIAGLHGWPVPVHAQKDETDRCYEQCLVRLMAASPRLYPAVATHNPRSLAMAMALAQQHGLARDAWEFQMLFGMAEPYQQALVSMDYRLRVYVPFGEAIPGMAYLVRRLLENAQSQSLERMELADRVDAGQLLRPTVTVAKPPQPASAADFPNLPAHRFVTQSERAGFQHAIEQVESELGLHVPLLLAGRFESGDGVVSSFDPAMPERLVGTVSRAREQQVDQAVSAANRAFPLWRDTPVADRARLLRMAAERMESRRDEFAAWEIFEAGKNWLEADADVCEAIDFLRFYADEAERLAQPRKVDLPGEENRHLFQPRGVGVVIPPWNFPLAIITGMLAATLASGNCAILKPSSETPVVAGRLVQLLHELEFPDGVIQFLPGPGNVIGARLVRHPDIHLIAFTGSRAVGTAILQQANVLQPGQQHLKKVIAELGGKNAIIVDTSADMDEAISGIVQSAFGYQGQKCSACSRVIVVGRQYDTFVKRLCDAIGSLRIAPPREPGSEVGPVINAAARRRLLDAIEQGKGQGRLMFQADVTQMYTGHYVGPALFRDVEPDSRLAQEELFGPVLATMPAGDFDTALRMANGTAYALTGGVYSRSPANLRRARREFRVGNLYLNRGITGALVARQPFGGFRLSGTASKAGGRDYLPLFMESRCVTENTLRRGVAPD